MTEVKPYSPEEFAAFLEEVRKATLPDGSIDLFSLDMRRFGPVIQRLIATVQERDSEIQRLIRMLEHARLLRRAKEPFCGLCDETDAFLKLKPREALARKEETK